MPRSTIPLPPAAAALVSREPVVLPGEESNSWQPLDTSPQAAAQTAPRFRHTGTPPQRPKGLATPPRHPEAPAPAQGWTGAPARAQITVSSGKVHRAPGEGKSYHTSGESSKHSTRGHCLPRPVSVPAPRPLHLAGSRASSCHWASAGTTLGPCHRVQSPASATAPSRRDGRPAPAADLRPRRRRREKGRRHSAGLRWALSGDAARCQCSGHALRRASAAPGAARRRSHSAHVGQRLAGILPAPTDPAGMDPAGMDPAPMDAAS